MNGTIFWFIVVMVAIFMAFKAGYSFGHLDGESVGRDDEKKFLCDLGIADKAWCDKEFPKPDCKQQSR